jgi:hypothetical protein
LRRGGGGGGSGGAGAIGRCIARSAGSVAHLRQRVQYLAHPAIRSQSRCFKFAHCFEQRRFGFCKTIRFDQA